MNRRDFLQTAGAISAGLAFNASENLSGNELAPSGWRTFEVTTRIEILEPSGRTRVWLPAALPGETPFQKTIANTFHCQSGEIVTTPRNRVERLEIIAAEFPAGAKPILTVTHHVATRNWTVDLAMQGGLHRISSSEYKHFLRSTQLVPTDGIVKQKAIEITRSCRADLDKARALYEWIVENTYRNPRTRGCGVGNIRFMLESGDLSGKCADLNTLFVGLARAVGLPARDVYGLRVAGSRMGCKSLGVASENVTTAQHCRAEVYLSNYGWVPVDPADVRKVMMEEAPGNRSLENPAVKGARARLFGSWEMNWMAYNFAQDVTLPGSTRAPLHFLMYPQAETAQGTLDSLDPDRFRYQITAREIQSAGGRRSSRPAGGRKTNRVPWPGEFQSASTPRSWTGLR